MANDRKAWGRARSIVGGSSRSPGARVPTPDEQHDAEWLTNRVSELLAKLSSIGFQDNEGVFFIAEIAFEPNEGTIANWSTKAGAIRAVRMLLQGHAVLDWGYERIDRACSLIENDLI